jgi:hypothetical protein
MKNGLGFRFPFSTVAMAASADLHLMDLPLDKLVAVALLAKHRVYRHGRVRREEGDREGEPLLPHADQPIPVEATADQTASHGEA